MSVTTTVTATGGMSAFAALFEESLKSNDMRVGEVISAEVVRIEFNHVVVNAGLKSESYVAIEEFKNDQGELEVQVGDFRLGGHRRGRKRLRRHHPQPRQGQAPGQRGCRLENSLESGEFVTGTVSGKVKGGLTVLVNGIRRLPAGQPARHAPCEGHVALRGQDHGVQGHQARPQAQQRRVEHAARWWKLRWAKSAPSCSKPCPRAPSSTAWSRTSPNTVRLSDLGGIDGLLHITDMAWRRVRHPSEVGHRRPGAHRQGAEV